MPHLLKNCPCLHPDDQHQAFPHAVGGGHFVLCSSCSDENWEPGRAAVAGWVEQAKAALLDDPTNENLQLSLELAEASAEVFESKKGNQIDEARLNAAMQRIAEINVKLMAIWKFDSGGSRGQT